MEFQPSIGNNADTHLNLILRVEPALDEEQFERHKASLVSDILRPDKNLNERAEYYWQSMRARNGTRQPPVAGRRGRGAHAAGLEGLLRARLSKQRHSLQVVAPGKWGVVPKGEAEAYDSPRRSSAACGLYD
ncbi:MAG: hypothetical protein IPG64_20435 [Haliea sp.]|nr:hypothetical protein [Haliea sp.]